MGQLKRKTILKGFIAFVAVLGLGGVTGHAATNEAGFISVPLSRTNPGVNSKDHNSNINWDYEIEDANNPGDNTFAGMDGNDYLPSKSAVNIANGTVDANIVLTFTNPNADKTKLGDFKISIADKNGVTMHFGSTTTPDFADFSQDVSATTGGTVNSVSYTNSQGTSSIADLSQAEKKDVTVAEMKFTLQPNGSMTFKIPVTIDKGVNGPFDPARISSMYGTQLSNIFGQMIGTYTVDASGRTVFDKMGDIYSLWLTNYSQQRITADDATVTVGTAVNTATFNTNPTDAQPIYKNDAGEIVTDPSSKVGTYQVTLSRLGYAPKTVQLTVKEKAKTSTTTGGGGTTTTTPVVTPEQPHTTPTTTGLTGLGVTTTVGGQEVAAKGQAVYAVRGIYLYKSKTFTSSARRAYYKKATRVNRPMFVVTGYAKSKTRALRYIVRDVNHTKKTDGWKGYITASSKYVMPVYYAALPKSRTITVIAKNGINAYNKVNLTSKAKHYKKGAHLKVKKIVRHNLTTRYVLSNGDYITANKKLIIAGYY